MDTLLFSFYLILLIFCAVFALFISDLASAVVIFGAFSFFSALLFTIIGALDVAFTEACIGAAISTVFFVFGINRLHSNQEGL